MRPGQKHRALSNLTLPFGPILERLVRVSQSAESVYPVMLIIGPPRSGTSISFQTLAHGLDVHFPNHLYALFRNAPFLGMKLGSTFAGERPHKAFSSVHGFSTGDGFKGPNEWEQFFRQRVFFPLRADPLSRSARQALLELNGTIQNKLRKGFLAKPLNAAFHIDTIIETLPGVRFIAINRDLDATIASIIKAKRVEGKTKAELFYAPPPELEGIAFETERDQVAAQVQAIRARMERTLEKHGDDRIMHVKYKDVCANPIGLVQTVQRWVGPELQMRPGSHLPDKWAFRG